MNTSSSDYAPLHALTDQEIKTIIGVAQGFGIDVQNTGQLGAYLNTRIKATHRYCKSSGIPIHFDLLGSEDKVLWLLFQFFWHWEVSLLMPKPLKPVLPPISLADKIKKETAKRIESLLMIELIANQIHQSKANIKFEMEFMQAVLKALDPETDTLIQSGVDYLNLACKINDSVILPGVKKLIIQGNGSDCHIADGFDAFTNLEEVWIENCQNKDGLPLPPSFFRHKKIMTLSVSHSHLIGIPHSMQTERLSLLNLPHNGFTEVPKSILANNYLHTLDLSDNKLTELPDEIIQLEGLFEINLSNNCFTEFPEVLLKLKNLIRINLRNNQIEALSPAIAQQLKDQHIDLRDNLLNDLPDEFKHVIKKEQYNSNLWSLLLMGNPLVSDSDVYEPLTTIEIKQLTSETCSTRDLTCLFCWANFHPNFSIRYDSLEKLEEIMDQADFDWMKSNWKYQLQPNKKNLFKFVFEFGIYLKLDWSLLIYWLHNIYPKEVTHIDLSGLDLSEIPLGMLNEWPKLKSLRLSENRLHKIGTEITHLSNLQKLYLDNTSLALDFENPYEYALPLEISHMEKLIRLDLQNNALMSLPPGIGLMDNLKELNLSNNRFKEFPIELCELEPLESLDINSNQITSLPEDIIELEQLKKLNLNQNVLQELPALPPSIEVLQVETNALKHLKAFDQFPHLRELRLANNLLEEIPVQMVNSPHLRVLSLRNNQIKTIPVHLGALTDLEELDLSENYLETISSQLGLLSNLTYLNLYRNQLALFPEEILQLHNLEVLKLNKNPFTEIPEGIRKLKKLKELWIGEHQNSAQVKEWLPDQVVVFDY